MNYIEEIKKELNKILKMDFERSDELLDLYTLLVFTVGKQCTNEDIHDAWSIWQSKTDPSHNSLIPFGMLEEKIQGLDSKYRDAVIKAVNIL